MPVRLPARFEKAVARSFLRLPPGVLRRIVGPTRRSPDGLVLDIQVQALLWLMRRTGEPEMHEGGVERARRRMERVGPTFDVRGVRDVSVYDRTVPGAADTRRTRIYTPSKAKGGEAAGLVWFHGGGFVLGSIESHDGVCRGLASRAGVVVASVDYRLAPEHRFPASVEDAIAATRWILENARSLGMNPGAIAVGGDSAGGNLAAVVAQALRGKPHQPAFQLLVYPATDMTRREASHRLFGEGLLLTERSIDWFLENYLPEPSQRTDPLASPLFATDLAGLPPALVITGGFDPLRDEGRAYAERMRAAGVEVEHVCSEGLVHGYFSMAGDLREAARMFALSSDRLGQALSRRVVASAA